MVPLSEKSEQWNTRLEYVLLEGSWVSGALLFVPSYYFEMPQCVLLNLSGKSNLCMYVFQVHTQYIRTATLSQTYLHPNY